VYEGSRKIPGKYIEKLVFFVLQYFYEGKYSWWHKSIKFLFQLNICFLRTYNYIFLDYILGNIIYIYFFNYFIGRQIPVETPLEKRISSNVNLKYVNQFSRSRSRFHIFQLNIRQSTITTTQHYSGVSTRISSNHHFTIIILCEYSPTLLVHKIFAQDLWGKINFKFRF
jgi:hypothetical protein